MKKKVAKIAAFACAVGIACLTGSVGCKNSVGGDNIDVGPSVEVTEAEWNEAFRRAKENTNLTARTIVTNCEGYRDDTVSYVFGEQAYEVLEITEGDIFKSELYYEMVDGRRYYTSKDDNGIWLVHEEPYDKINEALSYKALTLDETEDLQNYGDYTFADGKYTFEKSEPDVDVKSTVKINEEGYLSFIEYSYYEDGIWMATYSSVLYNYGTTSYNVPSAAIAAVAAHKAQ